MLTAKGIEDYCMSKPCTYESRPFGELPICYRVGGKIFAQFNPNPDWYKITLKTNPDQAYAYREMFPGVVVRGYHCPTSQQPYWNTISLDDFPDDVLLTMIDEAYTETVKGLTKKQQRRLQEIAEYEFQKTDGANEEFTRLCKELDEYVDDVILVYHNGQTIGCAAYRFYDEETVELKRFFLKPDYRGTGLGRELLMRLEADARIQGYRKIILESGELLVEAMELYRKLKYKVIPNYGQYVDMTESICMGKKL